jgi:hypothetical protein
MGNTKHKAPVQDTVATLSLADHTVNQDNIMEEKHQTFVMVLRGLTTTCKENHRTTPYKGSPWSQRRKNSTTRLHQRSVPRKIQAPLYLKRRWTRVYRYSLLDKWKWRFWRRTR